MTHLRGSDDPRCVYAETLEGFEAAEAYCERFHIAYGHPEEVVASLQADQVFAHATELILRLDPISPTLDQTMQMFEQIATHIAPALGWQRATDKYESHL